MADHDFGVKVEYKKQLDKSQIETIDSKQNEKSTCEIK